MQRFRHLVSLTWINMFQINHISRRCSWTCLMTCHGWTGWTSFMPSTQCMTLDDLLYLNEFRCLSLSAWARAKQQLIVWWSGVVSKVLGHWIHHAAAERTNCLRWCALSAANGKLVGFVWLGGCDQMFQTSNVKNVICLSLRDFTNR